MHGQVVIKDGTQTYKGRSNISKHTRRQNFMGLFEVVYNIIVKVKLYQSD